MDNTRYPQRRRRAHHRHADKTTLGKEHVGLNLLQVLSCLPHPLNDTKRVGEIFGIKIPPEFAGCNAIVRNIKILDQFLFNPVVGSHIYNVIF